MSKSGQPTPDEVGTWAWLTGLPVERVEHDGAAVHLTIEGGGGDTPIYPRYQMSVGGAQLAISDEEQ